MALASLFEQKKVVTGPPFDGRVHRILTLAVKDADVPRSIDELERNFVEHVGRFFATYHEAEGNQFKVLGMGDSEGLWISSSERSFEDETITRGFGTTRYTYFDTEAAIG